jgi:hypothetical protein
MPTFLPHKPRNFGLYDVNSKKKSSAPIFDRGGFDFIEI